MLQNIRDNLTGRIALVVLGVIALSFVFVGGANFATIGQSNAATVDDAKIGIAQFENAYRTQLQQNPQLATLPPEFRLQVRRNVLEQLVQQQVIDNYLDDIGYRIADDEITRLVQQQPDFQVDGAFDMDTYVNAVQAAGYDSAKNFEDAQRTSLRRMQLQRAIRGTSIVAPSAYRRYLNLALEQRVVQTATISAAAVADEVDVTDDKVTAFYDENPSLYQLEETADVEYVEIRRQEVAAAVSISEAQLFEYYDLNKDRYEQDEQRRARHILVLFDDDEAAAEVTANEVHARLMSGESFAALAKEYSKDTGTAEQGGDLGALTESQLPEGVGEAAFAMDEGELRGPLKGDFGFHVVRLDEILESGPLPFEQVRAALLTEMQDEEAEGLYRDLERELSNALFESDDIQALAAAVGLDVKSATGITRTGGQPFGDSQLVADAIFDSSVLAGTQMSELVEVDDNSSVVFFVTQHNEATRLSLDDVREQIVASLTQNQSEELMAARAGEMQDALASGEDFSLAAAAVGAEVQPPVSIRRDDTETDQQLAASVFAAPKPSQDSPSIGSTRNAAGGYTVYSVQAVLEGRPEAVPVEQRDAGKLQVTDTYGVGDFVAFVQALRADADVEINEDALAAQDLLQ